MLALQVAAHQIIEPVFLLRGDEVLHQGCRAVNFTLRLGGAMCDGKRVSTAPSGSGTHPPPSPRRIAPEALVIIEHLFINEAHEAVQFHQGVLQWCGGE